MSELEELYQEIVMEHNRRPRNFREPAGANRRANGFNPFCGDMVTLFLEIDDDTIADVGFQGSGCAISKASASMLTESVKGASVAEAAGIFDAFHRMLTDGGASDGDADVLGDLEVLSGVSAFPTRVKCAVLSWHALRSALEGRDETVKTE